MGYTVLQELIIPEGLKRLRIKHEDLKACGYDPENFPLTDESIFLLYLSGRRFTTGHWVVEADVRIGHRILDTVQVGKIKCDHETGGGQVLDITRSWICASEKAEDALKCTIGRPSRPGNTASGIAFFRSSQ